VTGPVSDLMHLIDRAEAGSLLPDEAVQLRAGVRELVAGLEQARRTAGGLTAEVRRLRGQGGAVSAVEASGAAGPRRAAAGRSGGDGAGFNGGGRASSRAGDSRTDPSEAENALRGGSPDLAASDGPGPASDLRTPATATTQPLDHNQPEETTP
jgi:hypothetical protein